MKAIKNKTRILKFLSISLSIIMLLASLPNIVFAESTSLGSISDDSNASLMGSGAFLEDESMRDKFSKHYVLEDGSRFAVIFPEAVHYNDGGEWKEIDNRLTYNIQRGKYVSANPEFSAAFAENASSGELVSISADGYTVSWSISFNENVGGSVIKIPTNASPATVKNGSDVAEKLSEAKSLNTNSINTANATSGDAESVYKNTVTDLGKAVASISYMNAASDTVSLSYSLSHQKIEEDIILRSKSDFASYTLTINTGGLAVVAENDGSVTFNTPDGETVFTIDAPWMQDSAYGFSKDIAVTVAQSGNTATVTYTPSAEWLASEDRVYPVLIDPTFTTRDYTANYVDTHVLSGGTDYTYYDDMQSLYAGSSPVGEWKSYIKFLNIPNISEDAFYGITDAALYLWTTSSYNFPLTLSKANSAWAGQTNIPEPTSTLIESNVSAVACSDGTCKYIFNLIDYANAINYFENIENGFKIEGASSEPDTAVTLNSSEAASHRPILTFDYAGKPNDSIHSGSVYSFKSEYSSKYLAATSSSNNSTSNAYQYKSANAELQDFQAFRVEYYAAESCYKLRVMSSPDNDKKYLGFPYSSTATDSGYAPVNVSLYPDSNSANIQWMILPVEGTSIFTIVSKADPNLALTVNGTINGSLNGTGVNNTGNVILKPYTGANNQKWALESGGVQIIEGKDIFNFTENDYGVVPLNLTKTFNCAVDTLNGAIEWESSNTSIATVNNYGVICPNQCGKIQITAKVYSDSEKTTLIRECSFDLYVTLPVWGYELDYEPERWSRLEIQEHTNCYLYAINVQTLPNSSSFWNNAIMGWYAWNFKMSASDHITPSIVYDAVLADYQKYNETYNTSFIFQPIGKYDPCPEGTYKVALVVGSTDYHWYRQDSDGLWSHKRGLTAVTRLDASGNPIYDPQVCDRDYTSKGNDNYYQFVGYFAVTPWNTYFEG